MQPDLPDLESCEDALRFAIDADSWNSKVIGHVRSMVGDEHTTAMVMGAARLHHKASQKLGPGLWWCSERSLVQSTAHQVARLKARWAGGDAAYDLCCGLGSDSIAISRAANGTAATTIAIDRDPTVVAMARENVRLNSGRNATRVDVRCADVSDLAIDPGSFVHIDPDRRTAAGRKTRVIDYSPSWDVVSRLIDRAGSAVVKVAPVAEIDHDVPAHRTWISLAGSVREQTLLFGSAITAAATSLGHELTQRHRSAVVLTGDGAAECFVAQIDESESPGTAESPRQYMIDPDAAIRGAGLSAAFAINHNLRSLGDVSGFMTGDAEVSNGLATCERVIWSGACDDRKLRKTLRSMNCFPKRVKTRGVSQDANALEKRYRQCGDKPITLWIGKTSHRRFAAITDDD